MTEKLLKLGRYRHTKSNKLYEVIGFALHTETLEEMVIYKALYHCEKFGDQRVWARPKEMFLESIELNGDTVPRFLLAE